MHRHGFVSLGLNILYQVNRVFPKPDLGQNIGPFPIKK